MDFDWTFLVCCICILGPALLHLLRRRRINSTTARRPPGPPGWPVFGNMFSLGSAPYKTIAELKKDYGPVISIRIGSMKTVALVSAEAAAELFKNHDLNFADRTVIEVMRVHDFHKSAMSLAPYGPYWRQLKRVATVELLVQKRINETEAIRLRCIGDMVGWIAGESGRNIHVGKFIFLALFNMLGNMVLSRDLVNPQSEEGSEFFAAVTDLMEGSGRANMADFFPGLKWLDPQGLQRKADRRMKKTLDIIGGYVAERIKERQLNSSGGGDEVKKDFLEVLLESTQGDEANISNHALNIILMELFFAGTDTTRSTIEWAMVELLSNPEAMIKAKNELAQVVGKGNKFEDKYIENLPYLQAVFKETLRLHPILPFLVPRKAIQDTNFMGYHIPKDTQLFVNVWAIGRDPECWEDPLSFKPERFLGSNIDYKGQNFELIPFGAGRRICVGIPLAHRLLHVILGSLLHEFDWEVDEVSRNDLMDKRESIGLVVSKLLPLKAIPRKCSM